MTTEYHNTTSRYYPVTKKDHERGVQYDHNFCECEDEGMSTHNTTSKYVPVGGNKRFCKWMQQKNQDAKIKSNWFGMDLPE